MNEVQWIEDEKGFGYYINIGVIVKEHMINPEVRTTTFYLNVYIHIYLNTILSRVSTIHFVLTSFFYPPYFFTNILLARNITESVVCLECTACMTVTNLIQPYNSLSCELRNKEQCKDTNTGPIKRLELCAVWEPLNLPLFPNGFTYDGCMRYFEHSYNNIIDVATVVLRPERICSLEIGWCELNEVPNIVHCLRELCLECMNI
uniref:Uncharacterized protein n=1 Tax=Heterorhabditis bacteriophora TaxID=37862 RepID=A0A1I7XBX5_HETBA